jgi:hypothetical protein
MTTKKKDQNELAVSSGASVSPTVSSGTGTPTVIVSPVTAKPPAGFQEDLQKMLQGIESYLPAGSVLTAPGGGLSQATIVAQLESALGLYSAVTTAKQAATQAVATLRAAVPGVHALMVQLKAALIALYGRNSPELEQFGLTVAKAAAKPSGLKNAIKGAKAKQTRLANGTLGKKQKAQLAFTAEAQSVASILIPQGTTTAAPQQSVSPAAPVKPLTSGQ